MAEQNTVVEYPTGLSSIPFASFLQIEKYSYDEAQKKVATQFNDALGSLNRSKISDVVRFGANRLAEAYGSGTPTDSFTDYALNEYKTEKTTTKVKRGKRTFTRTSGGRTINITDPSVDPNTRVVLKNGETTTVGQLLKKKQEMKDRQNKGLMSTVCNLPLPNEFQYKYGADWNNEFKLGTLALAADEAGKFAGVATAGGIIGGGLDFLSQKLTTGSQVGKISGVDPTKIVQSAVSGLQTAADPFKMNSPLNPKNVAGLAGLAPNENSIQFFERMQGREFSFRFELAARNKKESNRIIEIIEWFKRGMHPNSKSGRGSAVMLTFPDVFVLTPKFVKCSEEGDPLGDPIQHPMMPRTKLCALTGLTINTTPFGQLQTIFDGTIPMVTMELMFKETTKLTRVDMEGASYTDKRNSKVLFVGTSDGGFIADQDKAFTGDVSF
jgi:hypothetical protein|tara:strand:+ start:421 stop:1737 length:1317 start_codon:yes stop_codon:yes gene_type:complete